MIAFIEQMELNNDELGEMGENRFAELCASAKLICNKSRRDRGGWDFIVEFGFDDFHGTTLDKRPGPMSCHVQVKTITAKAANVRMSLSMAERLAKEQKPSFLFVLRVDEMYQFTEAYLLHIVGDRLASVLKRLRKESAKSSKSAKTNRMDITFTPKKEERIAISGFSLRKGLEEACGSDVSRYSLAKGKQLKELGYKEAAFQLKVKFDSTNRTELEEAFLGSGKGIVVSNVSAYETRFDITLPEFESIAGTIVIEPAFSSTWRVTFRAPGMLPASISATTYIVPPQISGDRRRIRVSSDFVEFNFTSDETGTKIDLKTDFRKEVGTIEEWVTYYRMCQAIHLRGTIEMEPPNAHVFHLPLKNHQFDYNGEFSNHLMICNHLAKIAMHAGIEASFLFRWDAIVRARNEIGLLQSIIDGEQTSISFTGEAPADSEDQFFRDMLVLNSFKIGDLRIGYSIKTSIDMVTRGDVVEITLSDIAFHGARVIPVGHGLEWYSEHIRMTENSDRIGWFKLSFD